MDQIKSVVSNELSNKSELHSLKVQNHIYGCFILMEDIAQGVVDVSGTIISTPKYTFDYDKQFEEIGVRYGFALDTKLALNDFHSDYKDSWIKTFNDINIKRNITEVDSIEDCLIAVIQRTVLPESAFFVSALETGSLPQEWIEKLLKLVSAQESDEEVVDSALTKALSEKPVKRRLVTTRRAKVIKPKKALAKTRKH